MAAEGQRWTSFYAGAPVCSPSRAALLTGRLPVRTGVYGEERPDTGPRSAPAVFGVNARGGLPPSEITVAEVLKPAGYRTAIIGTWHLGDRPEYLPQARGFDLHFGLPYSNDMAPTLPPERRREGIFDPRSEYWNVPLLRNGDVVEGPVQQEDLTRRITDEAIRFIEENRDAPFLLYGAHPQPHVPLFRSKAFAGRSGAERYSDVIEEIDASVGRLLDVLRQGLAQQQRLSNLRERHGRKCDAGQGAEPCEHQPLGEHLRDDAASGGAHRAPGRAPFARRSLPDGPPSVRRRARRR